MSKKISKTKPESKSFLALPVSWPKRQVLLIPISDAAIPPNELSEIEGKRNVKRRKKT